MKGDSSYDFEVHSISRVCYTTLGEVCEKHRAPFECCVILNSGQPAYLRFLDGRRLYVPQNAAIFLPCGARYTILDGGQGSECYVVCFTLPRGNVPSAFVALVKDKKTFFNLFREMQREWELQKPHHILRCKSLLYTILYKMRMVSISMRDDYIDTEKKTRLCAAVDYMREHYSSDELKSSELAEMCGVSAEYFRRIFKSVYGVTPREYIKQLRMERAGELLLSGKRKITEVAAMSGYSDLSQFSRKFKEFYGVSPREYRAK